MHSKTLFLHGLDSSSNGTKGRFFTENFPQIISSDFTGTLENRLMQLHSICKEWKDFTLIGSSLGGLMAACYAISYPAKIRKLILMAPALNYCDFKSPVPKISIPTIIIIGKNDTVTPPKLVVPLANKTFSNLALQIVDDDHMLHATFKHLDWSNYLQESMPTE